jgi:hypothetical protein
MIPDWKLERYLTGDLSAAEAADIRAKAKEDGVLCARIEELRRSSAEILSKYPVEEIVPEMLEKTELRKGFGKRMYIPLLAAAVLLVVLLPLGAPEISSLWKSPADVTVQNYSEDGTRIKGLEPRFEIWRKTADSAERLAQKSVARAGDELQIRYAVPEKCFGMIFSLDGRGVITYHLSSQDRAVALAPGKMTALHFAYKLDDAPYFEKFFFVISASAFKVEKGDIDSLLKNKTMRVESLTLRKASVEGEK